MSWSITVQGTPAEVSEKLKKNADALGSNQSGDEYAAALPSLLALVGQNYVTPEGQAHYLTEPYLRLSASGSGTMVDTVDGKRECRVTLEIIPPPDATSQAISSDR